MKSKFKNKTFKTEKEFQDWLASTASYKIELMPQAGDLSIIHVHFSGEILHCDFHSRLYNGAFIKNPKALQPGFELMIKMNGEPNFTRYSRLVVKSITKLN